MATQKSGKPGLDCVLAAGVAFTVGVLTALSARRKGAARHRSAETLRAENLRASLVDYQKLQLGLLERAIDDPELAAVLSPFEVEPANALYSNALFGYRIGVATMEELHGHLRVLCRSALFRKYWESTRPHRASLKDDSEEGRIGRMVDNLIRDLDEADTEEWWVVGEPPAD